MLLLPDALTGDCARQVGIKSLNRHRIGKHAERTVWDGSPWYLKPPSRRSRALVSGSQQGFQYRIPPAGEVATVITATAQRQHPTVSQPVRQFAKLGRRARMAGFRERQVRDGIASRLSLRTGDDEFRRCRVMCSIPEATASAKLRRRIRGAAEWSFRPVRRGPLPLPHPLRIEVPDVLGMSANTTPDPPRTRVDASAGWHRCPRKPPARGRSAHLSSARAALR